MCKWPEMLLRLGDMFTRPPQPHVFIFVIVVIVIVIVIGVSDQHHYHEYCQHHHNNHHHVYDRVHVHDQGPTLMFLTCPSGGLSGKIEADFISEGLG